MEMGLIFIALEEMIEVMICLSFMLTKEEKKWNTY